jgi:hypothetical protein
VGASPLPLSIFSSRAAAPQHRPSLPGIPGSRASSDALMLVLTSAYHEGDVDRALALRARGWRLTEAAPGHGRGLGYEIEGVVDVRLMALLQAQVVCRKPTAWRVSKVEWQGNGL